MCTLHSLEAAAKINIICKSRLKWVGPLKINGHSPYNNMLQVCLSLMQHSTRRHPRQALVCQSLNLLEKGFSSTSTEDDDDDDDDNEDQDQSCVSPQSDHGTSRNVHAVARKLKFGSQLIATEST